MVYFIQIQSIESTSIDMCSTRLVTNIIFYYNEIQKGPITFIKIQMLEMAYSNYFIQLWFACGWIITQFKILLNSDESIIIVSFFSLYEVNDNSFNI